MKKTYLLFLPVFILAAGDGANNYDIIERTINFLLFSGILFYFLAQPAKEFYKNRLSSIASFLEAAQEKLKSSIKKKEASHVKVEEAKTNSKNIIITAKKEADILSKKILTTLDEEIKTLDKLYEDKLLIEKRRMTREVVQEILDEMFDADSINIDNDEFVDIVLKKVA